MEENDMINKDGNELEKEEIDGREELTPREIAVQKITRWAELLELDTKRELFDDILEVLTLPVEKEKLTYDEEAELFRYVLFSPVGSKTIVEIQETTFEQKKSLQKFKDEESMDAAGMMMSKHTNLTTAEVLKLKTRDQKRINAVVMGFLSQ